MVALLSGVACGTVAGTRKGCPYKTAMWSLTVLAGKRQFADLPLRV